jgi:hypothetical protein
VVEIFRLNTLRFHRTQFVVQDVQTQNQMLFGLNFEQKFHKRVEPFNNFLVFNNLRIKHFGKNVIESIGQNLLVVVMGHFIVIDSLA